MLVQNCVQRSLPVLPTHFLGCVGWREEGSPWHVTSHLVGTWRRSRRHRTRLGHWFQLRPKSHRVPRLARPGPVGSLPARSGQPSPPWALPPSGLVPPACLTLEWAVGTAVPHQGPGSCHPQSSRFAMFEEPGTVALQKSRL